MKNNILILILCFFCLGFTWTDRYANCGLGTGDSDGTSKANAWQGLDEAYTEVVAGERINLINSSECDITDQIDVNTVWGTPDAPIMLEGYTDDPGDGGIAVIDCQSNAITGIFVNEVYNMFKNLEIKNCDNDGINFNSTNSDDSFAQNVYIYNIGDQGINLESSSDGLRVIGCEIQSTDDGISAVSGLQAVYNYIHDISGGYGMEISSGESYTVFNIVDTTSSPNIISYEDRTFHIQNTLYNVTGGSDNLRTGAAEQVVVINNLLNTTDSGTGNQILVSAGGLIYFNLNNNMYDGGAGTKSGDIIYTEGESTANPTLNTTTFQIGAAMDDLGYPAYFDSPSGGTTVVGHWEPGAVMYEESGEVPAARRIWLMQ